MCYVIRSLLLYLYIFSLTSPSHHHHITISMPGVKYALAVHSARVTARQFLPMFVWEMA